MTFVVLSAKASGFHFRSFDGVFRTETKLAMEKRGDQDDFEVCEFNQI